MSYMEISNLYADQSILMFKECYALEKIHGTSARLLYRKEKDGVNYSFGGFLEKGECYQLEDLIRK